MSSTSSRLHQRSVSSCRRILCLLATTRLRLRRVVPSTLAVDAVEVAPTTSPNARSWTRPTVSTEDPGVGEDHLRPSLVGLPLVDGDHELAGASRRATPC